MKLVKILAFLALFLTTTFLFADNTATSTNGDVVGNDTGWYQIELIVFSHLTQQGLDSEQWPPLQAPAFNNSKLYTLTQDSPPASNALTLLPAKQMILKREAYRLEHNPAYKIVLHVSWKEIVPGQKRGAPLIHIFGGNVYNANGKLLASDTLGQTPYDASQTFQVNGTLQLYVQRYFNAKFNLNFAAPTSEIKELSDNDYFASDNNALTYFQLSQRRRMRSKELNYIGHPLYGVLIKIVPTTPPAYVEMLQPIQPTTQGAA